MFSVYEINFFVGFSLTLSVISIILHYRHFCIIIFVIKTTPQIIMSTIEGDTSTGATPEIMDRSGLDYLSANIALDGIPCNWLRQHIRHSFRMDGELSPDAIISQHIDFSRENTL